MRKRKLNNIEGIQPDMVLFLLIRKNIPIRFPRDIIIKIYAMAFSMDFYTLKLKTVGAAQRAEIYETASVAEKINMHLAANEILDLCQFISFENAAHMVAAIKNHPKILINLQTELIEFFNIISARRQPDRSLIRVLIFRNEVKWSELILRTLRLVHSDKVIENYIFSDVGLLLMLSINHRTALIKCVEILASCGQKN